MRLAGKTALITGASRNIGRETALTFAREGADLALSALNSREELEEVAAECRELGVKTFTGLADVAEAAECRRLVEEGLAALGKIDVLVSNAAIRPHHPLLSVTDEDWHRVFGINLHSSFYLCKAALLGMMARETGSIIAIGGMASITGRPDTAAVTAAKTGLWGLVRAVAAEFAPYTFGPIWLIRGRLTRRGAIRSGLPRRRGGRPGMRSSCGGYRWGGRGRFTILPTPACFWRRRSRRILPATS